MSLHDINKFVTFTVKALSHSITQYLNSNEPMNVCIQERNGDVLPIAYLAVRHDENDKPYLVIASRDIAGIDITELVDQWESIK